MTASVTTEATYTPEEHITGDAPILTDTGTLITGQNLVRLSVLGQITASSKYTLSLAASGDGSEVPVAILVEAVDATAADKPCIIYTGGTFDFNDLNVGTGHTLQSIKDAFLGTPLQIKNKAH